MPVPREPGERFLEFVVSEKKRRKKSQKQIEKKLLLLLFTTQNDLDDPGHRPRRGLAHQVAQHLARAADARPDLFVRVAGGEGR